MKLKPLDEVIALQEIDTLHQIKPLSKEVSLVSNTLKLILLSQALLLKGKILFDNNIPSSHYLKYLLQSNKIHKSIKENYIYSVDEMKQIKKDFKLRGL